MTTTTRIIQLLNPAQHSQAQSQQLSRSPERLYRSQFFPHTSSIYLRVLDQAVVSISSLTTALLSTHMKRVDLVIATAPPIPAAFTAFTYAKLKRVPFIVDLRDAWPELVGYIPTADPSRSFQAFIKRAIHPAFNIAGKAFAKVLREADGIITTSAWHAQRLVDSGNTSTTVVSNLPLVNLNRYRAEDISKPDSKPTGQLNVLYAGTIGRPQGLENAISAANLAEESGIRINLRFIGDGAHLKYVKQAARDSRANIEFKGRIPSNEISQHFNWTDTVLVHLQDWEPLEATMPSKMFEAIASGKHVTAAVNGEAAEFLHRFGHGDTAPAMDPIALADLWVGLAQNRTRIRKPTGGKAWLLEELERTNPSQTFISFIEGIARESK